MTERKQCTDKYCASNYFNNSDSNLFYDISDALRFPENKSTLRKIRHIFECDICYNDVEQFYGKSTIEPKFDLQLRKYMETVKEKNIELNDKDFHILLKGTQFNTSTPGRTSEYREQMCPGYNRITSKIKDKFK